MRILLITASALALTALGGCGNSPAPSATAYAPPPPVPSALPEPRPSSEPQTVEAKNGAYGMPTAPIPYDQLTAYDQQIAGQGHAGAPADEGAAPPKNQKKSDEVFY